MNKREFLRTVGAGIAGLSLSRVLGQVSAPWQGTSGVMSTDLKIAACCAPAPQIVARLKNVIGEHKICGGAAMALIEGRRPGRVDLILSRADFDAVKSKILSANFEPLPGFRLRSNMVSFADESTVFLLENIADDSFVERGAHFQRQGRGFRHSTLIWDYLNGAVIDPQSALDRAEVASVTSPRTAFQGLRTLIAAADEARVFNLAIHQDSFADGIGALHLDMPQQDNRLFACLLFESMTTLVATYSARQMLNVLESPCARHALGELSPDANNIESVVQRAFELSEPEDRAAKITHSLVAPQHRKALFDDTVFLYSSSGLIETNLEWLRTTLSV